MALGLEADPAPATFQALIEQLYARMGECVQRRGAADHDAGVLSYSTPQLERSVAGAQLRRYSAALTSLLEASEAAGSVK